MISLWKIIRNLLAIAGLIMLMGAIGTSDYYVVELEQVAPSYCSRNIIIGIVLMLPMVIHQFVEMYREGKQGDIK